MATHSAQVVDPIIWRARLTSGSTALADSIRETITENRAYLLDFIKFDEPHPHQAMTLSQWQRPSEMQSLLAAYSDHIYRNQPTLARENKPLLSLWAQWYIGLMVPPLMPGIVNTRYRAGFIPRAFPCRVSRDGPSGVFLGRCT